MDMLGRQNETLIHARNDPSFYYCMHGDRATGGHPAPLAIHEPRPQYGEISASIPETIANPMRRDSFTTRFSELPTELPLFPLPGVAVMPGTQLPLHIFEPRYLQMVFDVLGSHRMFGMIQPQSNPEDDPTPTLYRTGTAGRITSFSEHRDGRLMIVLTGVCRFDLHQELPHGAPPLRPYRRALVDWIRFAADYLVSEDKIFDRDALFRSLRTYCDHQSVELAWQDVESLEDQALINLLTMHLPLAVPEKQALIECVELSERGELLGGLLELSNARAGVGRIYH